MGMIINIDKALELRTDYNILREPLNALLQERQEAFEKSNPIDYLFVRNSISSFQETYTSSIGFAHALTETSDYAVAPIYNTAEGFSATYRTRTFQGGFIITQQTLEDGQVGKIKDDATRFITRWNGDIVEYAMKAISAGFGEVVTFGETGNGQSRLSLKSADTTDGDINTVTKNDLFCKSHKTVKRDGVDAISQSNIFRAVDSGGSKITIGGSDPSQIAKLADYINQVITIMENYKDDNGKYAGVDGPKTIVCANDAHLKAAINAALSMDMFGQFPNPAKGKATLLDTPYLRDIPQCAAGNGFFIVDKSYNEANHGPELTERIPLTMNVKETTNPYGISYDARQRFDINCASWRGIVYCLLGDTSNTSTDWNHADKFTTITVTDTIVKPVSVVGTVTTEGVAEEATGT